MRRAPPVVLGDDEARAAEFAALLDVVDVAAEGQPAVRAGLDEASDQRLGPGARHLGKLGAVTSG